MHQALANLLSNVARHTHSPVVMVRALGAWEVPITPDSTPGEAEQFALAVGYRSWSRPAARRRMPGEILAIALVASEGRALRTCSFSMFALEPGGWLIGRGSGPDRSREETA
jgi:hypothetical protein